MSGLRVALAAAAVVVCAWFAIGAHQAHDQARAQALLAPLGSLTPATTSHILRLLDDAAWLNPDRSVVNARAETLVRAGRPLEAERALLALVRSEPQNVAAWVDLRVASAKRHDERTLAFATARVQALVPPVPPAP